MTATLDWQQLGFGYLPTTGYVQVEYKDGAWGAVEVKTDPYLSLHIAANCLHYGQACFEGMKAFRTCDGRVVIFRPEMNARRMQLSAERLCMAEPPEELFIEACRQAVALNREFVPPYGTGASLYIRPFLIGVEPLVGVKPSNHFLLIVFVTPVGPYYKDGFHPVEAVVLHDYDRAAPMGTGRAKAAGNYAASLRPAMIAKQMGYPIVLFTDPREHKYVDEFGTSNFIGITPAGEYKTPDSSSILQSVTNDSLQVLAARRLGLTVIKEPIALDTLGQFSEVGACGTAAVITPVCAVTCGDHRFTFGDPDEAGPMLTQLFQLLQGIQYGDIDDEYGWLYEVASEEALR